jgi:hypothetical protein
MSSELFPDLIPTPTVSTRPISFTSESLRGIEEERKSQTRRVMYPQPSSPGPFQKHLTNPHFWQAGAASFKCPYGIPGDRLWVREVWARVEPFPQVLEKYGMPVDWRLKRNPEMLAYWRKRIIYLKDFPGRKPEECGRGASDNRWRSPVTLPRWASRMLLEVTEIRIERLQAISEADAIAEGVEKLGEFPNITPWRNYLVQQPAGARNFSTPIRSYVSLWDAINGRKNPWTANPWVWVVSFRRIEEGKLAA